MVRKIIESSSPKKIVYANACYTGGGIYIFIGKFSDGTYFISGTEERPQLYNVKKKPSFDNDDHWYEEWIFDDKNFLGIIENKSLWKSMIKWIISNKPKGNYSLDDMESLLGDNLD